MMRTTLSLDDDAMTMIRRAADKWGVSLGKAASDLVRNGARYQLRTKELNGLPVFDTPDDFPVITCEMVNRIDGEE